MALGPEHRGFHIDCKYLVEVTRYLGLMEHMIYGGYNVSGQWRTKYLSPSTIFKAAKDSNNRYEHKAVSALLRGKIYSPHDRSYNFTGGSTGESSITTEKGFRGKFTYPLNESSRIENSSYILRLAANILGAQYGYFYIRDNWLMPETYSAGMSASIIGNYYANSLKRPTEEDEIHDWPYHLRGGYWEESHPRLRDIYEVNLLSDKHLGRQIGTTGLGAWIRSNENHGTLVAIDEGRFLWTLTTRQMQLVRPQLISTDAIYARHDRVYRSEVP